MDLRTNIVECMAEAVAGDAWDDQHPEDQALFRGDAARALDTLVDILTAENWSGDIRFLLSALRTP